MLAQIRDDSVKGRVQHATLDGIKSVTNPVGAETIKQPDAIPSKNETGPPSWPATEQTARE
mgnify:CR=1 FL=1